MANEEHLKILKQGVDAWNQWRRENPDVTPDLRRADLPGANLHRVILTQANLGGTDLIGADLRDADISGANLSNAHLFGSNLSGADLSGTNLYGADLTGAELTGTNLEGTDLGLAHLCGTNLARSSLINARLLFTSFCDMDINEVTGLRLIKHQAPSGIGVDTLTRTLRGSGGRFTGEQLLFFEDAGVPPTLLEYLPSILETDPLQFYTCFISYSTQDEEFAEQVDQNLNKTGIKTWKWDRDAVRGRDLGENIDRAIRSHDKTILVCSANSLTSPQVEREIQQALDREVQIKTANAERRKEALAKGEPPPTVDADVLVPIRLDDTIFKWDSHLKTEVTRRMISDFTDAPPGSAKYNSELQKLIHALNPRSWPPQPSRTAINN